MELVHGVERAHQDLLDNCQRLPIDAVELEVGLGPDLEALLRDDYGERLHVTHDGASVSVWDPDRSWERVGERCCTSPDAASLRARLIASALEAELRVFPPSARELFPVSVYSFHFELARPDGRPEPHSIVGHWEPTLDGHEALQEAAFALRATCPDPA